MPTLWQRLVDAGIALLFGEADPEVPSKPKPKPRPKPAERTVHRVRQTYRTSCGVAATAMLARVSHNRAKAVLFPKGSVKGRYNTTAKQVMRALDHFQVPHGVRELDVQHYDDIPTTALVTVRWFEGDRPNYHWLILQRKSAQSWILLDPGADVTVHGPSRDHARAGKSDGCGLRRS